MKNRRDFIKAGLILGAGLPVTANWAFAAEIAPSPRLVYTFDARPLRELDLSVPANARKVWDTLHVLAALQGLVNRSAPRFYFFYCSHFGVDTDQFWFDWLREEDGWLARAEIRRLSSVNGVLEVFRDSFDGLAVYDPNVPATSNVASTAAGVERLLPVRFDASKQSLFTLLTKHLRLPVKLWLVNPDGTPRFTGRGTLPDFSEPSTGSAKADAYRWAALRWLKSRRCSPGVGAYYVDCWWLHHAQNGGPEMHTLTNHDWFIAHGGFFFDLSPWGDEPPVDDPHQPLGADKRCLLEILRDLYDCAGGGVIRTGGFPPWPYKYTNFGNAGRHGGVETEWEYIRLTSQFNAYTEADAADIGSLANASFFQHYPLRARYPQPNPKPTIQDWRTRGYVGADGRVTGKLFVGHYVGDYDAPSWLSKAVPAFFRDPARGSVPLGWAFDPNLSARAPQALAYAYRHATPNDFFIAGDSGAGYLNPRGLIERPDSRLPDGLKAWQEHCRRYFALWGMTITGFVLEGASGPSLPPEFTAYRAFSPDGIGTHFDTGPAVRSGVATCPERDLPDTPEDAAKMIAGHAPGAQGAPAFLWARATLKSPTWYAELSRCLREVHSSAEIEIVDPYTFFGLIHLAMA